MNSPASKSGLGQTIWTIALYVYFAGVLLTLPYFNWQYAQRHGFLNWMLLGEVIASFQATAWPYYVVTASFSSRSSDGVDQHFVSSRESIYMVYRRVEELGGLPFVSDSEAQDIAYVVEFAAGEAERVDDGFLASIHPELLNRYRTDYQSSLHQLAKGFRSGNQLKQVAALADLTRFSDWYTANSSAFVFPNDRQ